MLNPGLAACLSLCQCPPRLVVAYFSRQAVRLQHFITKRCRLRGRQPRRFQGPRQRETLQALPPLALPPRCPQTGSAWRSPQPSTQRSSGRWSHWRHQVLVWQLLCWVHSQVQLGWTLWAQQPHILDLLWLPNHFLAFFQWLQVLQVLMELAPRCLFRALTRVH